MQCIVVYIIVYMYVGTYIFIYYSVLCYHNNNCNDIDHITKYCFQLLEHLNKQHFPSLCPVTLAAWSHIADTSGLVIQIYAHIHISILDINDPIWVQKKLEKKVVIVFASDDRYLGDDCLWRARRQNTNFVYRVFKIINGFFLFQYNQPPSCCKRFSFQF